jgi:AcrR family transcriptional regulator
MVTVRRGRRPGSSPGSGSAAQEAILAAAKKQFSELGYPRTTIRGIARAAGVDPRLVAHYFGSKQELFVTVVELPFDPETAFARLIGPGPDGLGRRVAEFALNVLDSPAGRQTITGLLRAAASEEEAAVLIRDLLVQRLLTPLTRELGGDQPELRGSLLGSQISGLAFARHIVGLRPLVEAPREVLVDALAPVLDHYLTGSLRGAAT